MDIENNPYEVRLGWQVDLTKKADFIGKDALAKIKQEASNSVSSVSNSVENRSLGTTRTST